MKTAYSILASFIGALVFGYEMYINAGTGITTSLLLIVAAIYTLLGVICCLADKEPEKIWKSIYRCIWVYISLFIGTKLEIPWGTISLVTVTIILLPMYEVIEHDNSEFESTDHWVVAILLGITIAKYYAVGESLTPVIFATILAIYIWTRPAIDHIIEKNKKEATH